MDKKLKCSECGEVAVWHYDPCSDACFDGDEMKEEGHSHEAWCEIHVPRDCEGCNCGFDDYGNHINIPPKVEWRPCIEIGRLD